MDSKPYEQLHIAVFPYMAHGHMIPSMEMARVFARHGVKSTIITTPLNSPFFSKTVERDQKLGLRIGIQLINFPSAEAGLPEGFENVASVIKKPELMPNFSKAVSLLENSLLLGLQQCRPDLLVADMMFPWATEVAQKFGIPRLVFHGTGCFALCCWDSLRQYETHKKVVDEFEPFTIPGLPDQIKMTRSQTPSYLKDPNDPRGELMTRVYQSEFMSYGVVFNSFLGLESEYVEHYRNNLGRKAWHIGPFSLCNEDTKDKAQRGDETSVDEHECLKWLGSKEPESVLYVCFGSMNDFAAPQLLELAMALEASRQNFIWVVKKEEKDDNQWLPEGFEARTKGQGLIIRGWAPQLLILDHESVGGFMTHCGWNSTLEAVVAGVPMVTWPGFAEQFYNERLIMDILKVGVGVGALEWSREKKILIKKEDIEKAVRQLMVGKEGEEMRNRAKELKEKARKAVEEGGSSHSDMISLLEELKTVKMNK